VTGVAAAVAQLRTIAGELDASGDADGRGLAVLRKHDLMSYLVPVELGGQGGDAAGMSSIAEQLGAACLGVAVVWVMHCQMVAIVDEYAEEPLRSDILRRVAAGQQYLASVTTEAGKGGHMLTAMVGVDHADGRARFTRVAPVVSGGPHADSFLMTMRRSTDVAADDVVLVYGERTQIDCAVGQPSNMLGMRAAGNVPMTLTVDVPDGQVIDPAGGFARIATRTMAPLGHLGWASAWVGAAREAMRLVLAELRPVGGANGRIRRTDLALYHLARARCELDMANAMVIVGLGEYAARTDRHRDTPDFQILINNVKLAVSEHAFAAVNRLVEVAGLGVGYNRAGGDGPSLERILRDLRSASLMYANDRLLQANGKLALLDRGAYSFANIGPRSGDGDR
jgi:acyl-CoA dehydrogenase